MIPISLYGIDVDSVERFYLELPGLVRDAYQDEEYSSRLYTLSGDRTLDHLRAGDSYQGLDPFIWQEDIVEEIMMAIKNVSYPDVGLLEHLLSIDGIDCVRISYWMHFATNVYPIYSEKACQTLTKMGVETPFRPDDIASYGLYVARLEGLKLHAPAHGLPEIGLPRARILQLGLERFE